MRSAVFILVSLSVFSGCEKYRALPLNSEKLLSDVDRRRQLIAAETEDGLGISASHPLNFVRAKEIMQSRSPALLELEAEYKTKLAVSKIKTPIPNPAIEAGPNYAFGPDVSNLYRLQPFASIGFTLPTGRRLKRQDELNRALADQAYAETAIRYRQLYMELRRKYSELILAQLRIDLRRQIAESAKQSTAVSKRLIEGGLASALDTGLLELEQARLKTEELDAVSLQEIARANLASLTGISAARLEPLAEDALPDLPLKLQSSDELKQILVQNHPELARLRVQYEVAERALHLEVARQYPDLHIGPNFARETGEKKTSLGLTLGIELPIFDRNQQGVIKAKLEREVVRVRYEAAANRALSELERAQRSFEVFRAKLDLLRTIVVPQVNSNLENARKALEAGQTEALKLLEIERGQRRAQTDLLETELSIRLAWIDVEQAIGFPLSLFPSESAKDQPPTSTAPNLQSR